MQADRFTIKSQEALRSAIDLAATSHHSQVQPEHLLAVLLDQADSVVPGIVQVHARMRDVRGDGSDAQIYWPGLLQALLLARYRGFLMLDYEGIEDPATAVPRAAEYMRGLLHLMHRRRMLTQSSHAPPATETIAVAVSVDTDGHARALESAAFLHQASIVG